MDKDRILGAIIVPACIVGIAIYFWLVFFVAPFLILQATAFAAVALVLVILAWIAYLLAKNQCPDAFPKWPDSLS
jgi:predicted DNA-binding transcriptional regulator